nr:hypothetical protein [Nonomuraea jabiensis]
MEGLSESLRKEVALMECAVLWGIHTVQPGVARCTVSLTKTSHSPSMMWNSSLSPACRCTGACHPYGTSHWKNDSTPRVSAALARKVMSAPANQVMVPSSGPSM